MATSWFWWGLLWRGAAPCYCWLHTTWGNLGPNNIYTGKKVSLSVMHVPDSWHYFSNAQANFPLLESLIERIHEDGRIAEEALDSPVYARYKESPYLRNPLQQGNSANGNESELDSKWSDAAKGPKRLSHICIREKYIHCCWCRNNAIALSLYSFFPLFWKRR